MENDPANIDKNRQDYWQNITNFFYKTNTANSVDRRKYLAEIVSKNTNNIESILELGCSSGGNLLYINKKCPNIKITGHDICSKAMDYGRVVEKNPAEFITGSLYDLSCFKDKSFDMVFTCTVLIHIPPDKISYIIKEMIRISKYFVLNIEDHGVPGVHSYAAETPHRWIHDYLKAYRDIGADAEIYDFEKISGIKSTGGANHIIINNLLDKKFNL